jgi:2-polyprenyl-6-methoxyphenol hydroxylase-like FAD-dependent oxidoreductase
MNTGIQDGYNLAWKLACRFKDNADERLLDTYNEERLENAKHLLKTTDLMFGNSTIPLAAGTAQGTSLQEMSIKVVLYSAAAPFFVSMRLVLWGLRLEKSEPNI